MWAELEQEYTFEDRPLWWHKAGRQQTASGYGGKLTSSKATHLGGRQFATVAARRLLPACLVPPKRPVFERVFLFQLCPHVPILSSYQSPNVQTDMQPEALQS